MTVAVNDRRKTYAGNGIADTFVGPRTFDEEWISAYLTNDATGAVTDYLSSEFAVTGLRLAQSTITFAVPPPAGYTLTILRTVPVEQAYRFVNQGTFFPETHEDAFDTLTMMLQQHAEGLLDSSPYPVQSAGDFQQSGTGSVLRVLTTKVGEAVSLLDFIPVDEHAAIRARTSVYDATADIQAAVTAHKDVRAPAGTYLQTGIVTIPAGHRLFGDGMHATKFSRAGANQSYFALLSSATLSDVGFVRSGVTVATSGRLIDVSVSGCTVSGVYSDHCWDGLYITNCAGAFLERLYLNNWQNSGIYVNGGTNDVLLDQFILTSGATGVGIRLKDKCEAFTASNGDVIGGVYSMKTEGTAYVLNGRNAPAYSFFSNVYFDSSAQGVLLEKCEQLAFTDCWFSNRPGNGVEVGLSYGLSFDNCNASFCGANGYLLSAGAKYTTFTNCRAIGNNGQNVGANGFSVNPGVSDFTISGCTATNAGIAGAIQGLGIYVGAGASDRYVITGNNVTGNTVGGMSDGGTGTNKAVTGNIGYTQPWIAPGFIGAWVNFGGGNQDAGYRKDADGRVWLRGLIKSGALATPAFNLPAGFRPSAPAYFVNFSAGALGTSIVQANGDVVPNTGSNVSFSLDGISFQAV